MTFDAVESQIAGWRAYVAGAAAISERDLDELDAHLRAQIAELGAAGLTGDEDLLLALAAQLEEAQPWAARRPVIHAAGR